MNEGKDVKEIERVLNEVTESETVVYGDEEDEIIIKRMIDYKEEDREGGLVDVDAKLYVEGVSEDRDDKGTISYVEGFSKDKQNYVNLVDEEGNLRTGEELFKTVMHEEVHSRGIESEVGAELFAENAKTALNIYSFIYAGVILNKETSSYNVKDLTNSNIVGDKLANSNQAILNQNNQTVAQLDRTGALYDTSFIEVNAFWNGYHTAKVVHEDTKELMIAKINSKELTVPGYYKEEDIVRYDNFDGNGKVQYGIMLSADNSGDALGFSSAPLVKKINRPKDLNALVQNNTDLLTEPMLISEDDNVDIAVLNNFIEYKDGINYPNVVTNSGEFGEYATFPEYTNIFLPFPNNSNAFVAYLLKGTKELEVFRNKVEEVQEKYSIRVPGYNAKTINDDIWINTYEQNHGKSYKKIIEEQELRIKSIEEAMRSIHGN